MTQPDQNLDDSDVLGVNPFEAAAKLGLISQDSKLNKSVVENVQNETRASSDFKKFVEGIVIK